MTHAFFALYHYDLYFKDYATFEVLGVTGHGKAWLDTFTDIGDLMKDTKLFDLQGVLHIAHVSGIS